MAQETVKLQKYRITIKIPKTDRANLHFTVDAENIPTALTESTKVTNSILKESVFWKITDVEETW